MTPLLSVRNLSTTFATAAGPARAVDDVSFDLYGGETLGLVGESGAGKSVTALSILRLLGDAAMVGPESVVEYNGANLLTLATRDLRRIRGAEIAMVFQEPTASLNPVLTIGTQITETLHAHQRISRKEARVRALELLDLVGIADPTVHITSYPHQLSGGMQQRAMIAIALSCHPKVLIADEPTTALDVTIQAQILELLVDLKRQFDMAMILITHDLGIVAGVADRVAVMYGGQIIESASTRTLFERPTHPYTAALLHAIPRLDSAPGSLRAIPGAVPPATQWPPACRFHPRCSFAWDRCRADTPTLLDVSDRHLARCWLVDEPQRRPQ